MLFQRTLLIATLLWTCVCYAGSSLERISPGLLVDFADPSAPDVSDPSKVRIYTTAGEVLTWVRRRGESVVSAMQGAPEHSRLKVCHPDGIPLDAETAGEDAWDPVIRDGVLYASVMNRRAGEKHAWWPEDNWSRRTFAFTFDGSCWIRAKQPLWGSLPKRAGWVGHNYGHEFIRSDNGEIYVFYERVTEDRQGMPWKTALFARKLVSTQRASDEEIEIYAGTWPSTRRSFGGDLLEGARPFNAGGKYLISFSGGEYASDSYGIHLLWADKITGPYKPFLTDNGRDLKDFGAEVQSQLPLTWGAGRAVFFESEGEWWAIFHGIDKSADPDPKDGLRALYLAPVKIEARGSKAPGIRIGVR